MLPRANIIHTKIGDLLLFQTKDAISRILYFDGIWEPHVLAVSNAILDRVGSLGNVLDIGANLGAFTVPTAKRLKGNVYAFEAQRIVSMQLSANVIINSLDNVYIYNIAVCSSENTGLTMRVPVPDYSLEQNIGAASLLAEYQVHQNTNIGFEDVESRSIDSYGFSNIILIKVDVEGMELDVFNGCKNTLENNAFPPILFEAWPGAANEKLRTMIFEQLKAYGYIVQQFAEMDYLAQHKNKTYIRFRQ